MTMKDVVIAKHITDKGKISEAVKEATSTKATEGITTVGIKFKKLLHILILL